MKEIRIKKRILNREALAAQIFLLPFYLGLLFFFIRPVVDSVRMSFSNISVDVSGFKYTNVGFENYRMAFLSDADFATNMFLSVKDLAWQVPMITILAVFLALMINRKFVGRVFIRAVFFLPVIFASGIALSIVQSDYVAANALAGNDISAGVISQSNALGELLINMGLGTRAVDLISTISDNLFAMVWRCGIQMILIVAGLQSINPTLYEASLVEGASVWDNFWKITLPLLVPVILVVLIYTIVDSFTIATNAVMLQIINLSVQNITKLGISAAFSWSYFLLIIFVCSFVIGIFAFMGRENKSKTRRYQR